MNLIDYIVGQGILVAFGGNTHPVEEKQSFFGWRAEQCEQ